MMDVDLNDYIAGAYFLVKRKPREDWQSSKLLPESFITLSSCIGVTFGALWDDICPFLAGKSLSDSDFALPDNIWNWPHFDEGVPRVFGKIETLRHFLHTFSPEIDAQSTLLIGAGLPNQLYSAFQELESEMSEGLKLTLEQNRKLESGGQLLGYEMLNLGFGQFHHSWLCYHLENKMFELFNIKPNEYGLISGLDEVMKVYDWMDMDKEWLDNWQDPFYPWLLVSYPLAEQA